MNTPVTFHGVLAGAYRGKDVSARALLTHASLDGNTALCKTVRPGALCDMVEDGPLTCPVCQARLARLRAKEWASK
jgi:hypothetical protein